MNTMGFDRAEANERITHVLELKTIDFALSRFPGQDVHISIERILPDWSYLSEAYLYAGKTGEVLLSGPLGDSPTKAMQGLYDMCKALPTPTHSATENNGSSQAEDLRQQIMKNVNMVMHSTAVDPSASKQYEIVTVTDKAPNISAVVVDNFAPQPREVIRGEAKKTYYEALEVLLIASSVKMDGMLKGKETKEKKAG